MANFFDQFDSASSSPYAGAISSIESGGNYRAVGPHTGEMGRALGKYQVMSANVGPWSKEVLGREVSPQEFIQNPEIQDAVFNGKFDQYVEKYGPDGAARAWFAGEKGMKNSNAKDALGTTVDEYSRRFNKALGPQDAAAAVNQFAPDAPQAMAFADQKVSAAKPGASNFFDQFDEKPSTLPPAEAGGPKRVYINTPKPAEAKPDRGVIDAGARGVAQGVTANFGDEIRGLVEASGANPDDPASVYKLLSGALKYFSGDAKAKESYDTAVARERELNKTAEAQHPIASTVGEIGGALALPLGAAGQAVTLPGRIAAGATVGGTLGGLAGAGAGENPVDRISRGLTGAAVGGALGGAAPVAIEGVIRGGRALAQPVATAIRGVRDPEGEAARRTAIALQRDMNIDPNAANRLTPQEFSASRQSGGPAAIMDMGGETTRALARSAANTSPEGREVLNRAISDRFEGQSGRVIDWLRNTFHFPDAHAQEQALTRTAQTVNRTRYQRAFQDGDRQIISPEIERLVGSPSVVEAMRKASTSGKDRAITQGMGAFNPGVTVENGLVRFRPGKNGAPTYPNLAFWDATKRELDDAAQAAARAGRNGEAATLGDLARSLRTELDNIVPSYQAARAGASHFFGAQNALEAGQNFVTSKMGNAEARQALAQMTPTERQLFQDGFVSQFISHLGEVGDRRSVLNKVAQSPAARDRLNMVLGRQRAGELEAGLRVEGIMDLARPAVQGNSTTARQLAELGLAGGTYGIGTGGNVMNPNPSALMNAALVYGAARGKNRINENVSRRVAELLASNDPARLLQGIRLVARDQNLFNSLRSVDRGLARVGGEQAPVAPALQAAGISRADDQPNVPRPPGQ